ETHTTAETLFVKIAQLRLIAVIVGRAEQRPAQTATGNGSEVALDRFRLRHLGAIETTFLAEKCAVLEQAPIACHWAIFAQLEKFGCLTFQPNIVPFRLIKKHAGEGKNGIGQMARLDLSQDTCQYSGIWNKSNRNRRGGRDGHLGS